MTTPTCPVCGAKFAHDNVLRQCRTCGVPDEVLAGGRKALERWSKVNRPQRRGASFQRRRRRHGRPTGAPRKGKHAQA